MVWIHPGIHNPIAVSYTHLDVYKRQVKGTHLLFADDAEHGAGAPVGQVVIAALELDGTQVDVYKRQV